MTVKKIKLQRSGLRAWTFGQIKRQGGVCPLCKKPISLQVKGNKSDYAADHCHESGMIRGVLHRSCNAALGKLDNAVGRWGCKSMKYDDIIPYLRNVLEYYDTCAANPTNLIYPDHKTDEQKQELAKKRRRESDARRRDKARMQELSELKQDQE